MSQQQPIASVADPSILRQVEREIIVQQELSGQARTVAGQEITYGSATAAIAANSVTVTQSVNNQSGDVVTVYSTPNGINVTAVDQIINQYSVTDSAVSRILAGTGIAISSSGVNGTGAVTISSSLSFGNITSVNLDGNPSNVLRGDGTWAADANSSYGNSNVASYLPTYTGNVSANVVAANLFSGNGSSLTSLPGANISGTVSNANLSQYLAVSDVNNNFSYHVVLSEGSGDKSLHIDADDNLQYNPSSGLLTTTRLDATYVLANLYYSHGYLASNVAGLGNIATINLDGNVSNVLRGNGTFGPDANSSYGDSNVVSLLGSFGTNSISTTGNISVGDLNVSGNVTSDLLPNANVTHDLGSNTQRWNDLWLANSTIYIGDANISANGNSIVVDSITITGGNVGNIGNVASLNLDGNVSNLLTGNGTYVAIPVVPTVGNIATLNLDGNVSNLLTGNGTYVAIPTVPTVGNIATLNLDGSNSNVLYGNGVFAAVAGGANTGNVTFDNINIIGTGNLNLQPDPANVSSYLDIFISSGPDLHLVASAAANLVLGKDDGANVMTSWDGNVYVQSWNTGNNTQGGVWNFGEDGNLVLAGNTVAINFANGSSAFGNIVATNLDGNVSNVLTGNGTFAAVPAPTVSQDITSNGAMSIMLYDGNIKYSNTATVEPSSGNIAGGNISTNGTVTANTANITTGNITTINSGLLQNGNSNITVTANGNVSIQVAGGTTELVITSTGVNAAGTFNATGTVTGGNLSAAGTITANGGTYGEVVTTQFASVFAFGGGPNPQAIMQVRGSDGIAGMGIRAYTGLSEEIYANTAIVFTTGSTIRDKDSPTGGTTRATINANGLSITGIANISGNITGGNISTTGNISALNIGNITATNLDGNVSNVLNGNGTFVALPVINANTVIWSTAPVANTSTGTAGQAAYDSGGNLYICVATDTWAKYTGALSW